MAKEKILVDLDIEGKIDATGTVSGSNLSGINTGDQDLTGFATSAQGILANNSLQKTGGTITGDIVVGSNDRDNGMFGTYDSFKTQHIWSMGVGYRNSPTGVDFGNIYGLSYKHTNNATGGTMASGHQVVFSANGSPRASMGEGGFWALAGFYKNGSSNDNILLGGSGHKSISDFVLRTGNQSIEGIKSFDDPIHLNSGTVQKLVASTSTSVHFRKYENVVAYANSISTVSGKLRIEIPVAASTMWSIKVVIVEYDGQKTDIKTTTLTITGYAVASNGNVSAICDNPNRIKTVEIGRNTANNKTVILITPTSTFRYPKALLSEIYTHHLYSSLFEDPANYGMTITANQSDFSLKATVLNAEFLRDSFYATSAQGTLADNSVQLADFKQVQSNVGDRRKIQIFASNPVGNVQTNSTMGSLIMESSVTNHINFEFTDPNWTEGDILTMVNRSKEFNMVLVIAASKESKNTSQFLRLANGSETSFIKPQIRVSMQWIRIDGVGYWYEI
jgi:hypothetical protein